MGSIKKICPASIGGQDPRILPASCSSSIISLFFIILHHRPFEYKPRRRRELFGSAAIDKRIPARYNNAG
jgi:hypothetical protein